MLQAGLERSFDRAVEDSAFALCGSAVSADTQKTKSEAPVEGCQINTAASEGNKESLAARAPRPGAAIMASSQAIGSSHLPVPDEPFVAVGLLSTARRNTKANATQSLGRRATLREDLASFRHLLGQRVALRFLIARNGRLNSSNPVMREAADQGDIIFLNMTEAKHRCSLKYFLWFGVARKLFPTAQYFVLGDDDVYVQLAHLEADLRLVHAQTAGEGVLWGLLMWKAYYNNNTMETSTGFTGWDFYDWAAVAQRRAMVKCRTSTAFYLARNESANRTNSPACYIIRQDHRQAVLSGHMDPLPPFPYINGPLFGVSRSLAAMLADDPYPLQWLESLQRNRATVKRAEKLWGFSCCTQRSRTQNGLRSLPRARGHISSIDGPLISKPLSDCEAVLRLHQPPFACPGPVGDSVLGYWVASIALRRRRNVTLVNTPFMAQHIPWPSWHFSNRSIVLHGLRTEKHLAFRYAAKQAGAGRFEPVERRCGTCASMGWTTWPGTPMRHWRCCGKALGPGRRVRACVGKNCPRVGRKTLIAVSDSADPADMT